MEAQRRVEAKIVKAAEDKYSILASTKDVDRDGDIILPTAFKNLDAYLRKNPVILWAHNHYQQPVGKAVDGRVTENALVLDIVFADTAFGREVKYLYDNGFLNAFSVGFIPKTWEASNDSTGRTYTDVELLEVSSVPVPANAAATMLRQAEREGIALKEFRRIAMPDSRTASEGEGKRAKSIKLFARMVRT